MGTSYRLIKGHDGQSFSDPKTRCVRISVIDDEALIDQTGEDHSISLTVEVKKDEKGIPYLEVRNDGAYAQSYIVVQPISGNVIRIYGK